MVTTRESIEVWLRRGEEKKATHMIVVCDTFDHEDYPVYVSADEDVQTRMKEFDGVNMQRLMEVYNYAMPLADQLAEHRAWHP